MEFKLTGWNAVIALIVAAVFLVFNFETQTKTLETQGVAKVKNWLVAESERAALPGMQKAMDNPNAIEKDLAEAAKKLQSDNIEIVSVTRHGTGSSIVARVEVHYKNGQSPSGKSVRYLRMTHSVLSGWRVSYEVSKWSYYVAALL